MDIYIEYIFLDNLAVNLFLLYLTVYVLKKKAKFVLLISSAALGAVFSVLYPLLGYYNYIVKVLLAAVMVLIIRKYKNFSDYIHTLIAFYIASFALAGAVLMLSAFTSVDMTKYSGKIQLFPFCLFSSSFIILVLAKYCAKEIYRRKRIHTLIYPAKVQTGENTSVDIKAFYDSGNQLYDSDDGKPIVIISNSLFEKLPKEKTGFIMIKTVAGYKNLATVEITFRLYFNNNVNKIYKVRAGVSNDLSGEYDMILHTEMTGE